MTKLNKLTSWISLFLYISIFNCSTLYHTSIKFNPETDCTDQNFNEFDFNAFQISQKNPSRSIEAIYPKISSIEKPLIELFKDNHDNLLNLQIYTLTFHISSQGHLTCLVDSLKKSNDSLFSSKLQMICKTVNFDSLSIDNSVAKIKGEIVFNKTSTNLLLKDTVMYYQARSKKSIMCVVYPNLKPMRYLYNRYLRDGKWFRGKITVKFAINENGDVIFAKIIENTTNNYKFAEEELELIKNWKFQKIYNPNDVTEVVYPFIFSY